MTLAVAVISVLEWIWESLLLLGALVMMLGQFLLIDVCGIVRGQRGWRR